MVDAAVGRGGARARSSQRAARRTWWRRRRRAAGSPSRCASFDDGVGFRYELPDQPALADFEISDELTEFALADNARAWWIPSNRPRLDRSESSTPSGPVSTLDSVQTPLTMEMRDGRTFMVIHEANLVDYARMFLAGPAHGEPHAARGARAAGPTA